MGTRAKPVAEFRPTETEAKKQSADSGLAFKRTLPSGRPQRSTAARRDYGLSSAT